MENKGYTLIELLVSLLLILLISSITIISPKLDKLELKSVAYNMASTIRLVREYNISGNPDISFELISNKGFYEYRLSKLNLVDAKTIKVVPKSIAINNQIAINNNPQEKGEFKELNPSKDQVFSTIRFSDKSASGATTLKLEKNKLSVYYEITIIPTSGRVHVYERKK